MELLDLKSQALFVFIFLLGLNHVFIHVHVFLLHVKRKYLHSSFQEELVVTVRVLQLTDEIAQQADEVVANSFVKEIELKTEFEPLSKNQSIFVIGSRIQIRLEFCEEVKDDLVLCEVRNTGIKIV